MDHQSQGLQDVWEQMFQKRREASLMKAEGLEHKPVQQTVSANTHSSEQVQS